MPDDSTQTVYDQILRDILLPQVKKEIHWITCGIIGFSVFCICLGILGVVAVIKSIFL